MSNYCYRIVLAAFLGLPATYAAADPVIVRNLQGIEAGMASPVVLKVEGSDANCTFMGHLVHLAPGTPDEKWVIKAEQRTCLKSKAGNLTISRVQALVPLNALPIKRNSALSLYMRD